MLKLKQKESLHQAKLFHSFSMWGGYICKKVFSRKNAKCKMHIEGGKSKILIQYNTK